MTVCTHAEINHAVTTCRVGSSLLSFQSTRPGWKSGCSTRRRITGIETQRYHESGGSCSLAPSGFVTDTPQRALPHVLRRPASRACVPLGATRAAAGPLIGPDSSSLYSPSDKIRSPLGTTYVVQRLLGSGASCDTFEASVEQPPAEDFGIGPSERVAVKVLSLRSMGTWKTLDLFENEARVLSILRHPAIPRYLEYFEVETASDKIFHIVQVIAPGESLQALVSSGWRPTQADAEDIFRQILEVLKYLGEFCPPVVHRDVTPSNIIYCRETRRVSLVDFGFAGAEVSQGGSRIVSSIMGTFGYMAPEQFRGAVEPRSDLYAAGATALFLLTGRPPSDFANGLRTDVSRVVISNQTLKTLIGALMEPEPKDRPQTAKEALDILERRLSAPARSTGLGGAIIRRPSDGSPGGTRGLAVRDLKVPVGSRIRFEERSDGSAVVTVPPSGVSGNTVATGAFAVAWTSMTGIWTATALSGPAGWAMAAFSLPFWFAGAQLAKQTISPLVVSETLTLSADGTFLLEAAAMNKPLATIRGSLADVDEVSVEYVVSEADPENGAGKRTKSAVSVVLQEGARSHRFARTAGLSAAELKFIRDVVRQRLGTLRR